MSDSAQEVLDDVSVGVGVALELLTLAAKLWPALGSWLGGLVAGKTDPISLRVADILPVKSASEAAAEQLRGS